MTAVWSQGPGSSPETVKPLVDEAIDQETIHYPQGLLHAFLPCRAAVVVPDPELHRRGHQTAPEVDRFAVAEAEPWAAGHARACLPAQRRDVRRARGGVRSRPRHRLALRRGDDRPARGPRPETPQGRPGR